MFMTTKFCKHCKEEKPEESFYKNKKLLGGFYNHCIPCHKILTSRWYLKNKEKKLSDNKRWRQENREKWNEIKRITYWRDPLKYRRLSLEQHAVKGRIRRSKISKIHQEELKEIYRNRPKGFHVDHIVPLQGENVSGLHVPWNLQYLPAKENLSKSNKFYES